MTSATKQPQWKKALAEGNKIKDRRAKLKREVKAGEVRLPTLLRRKKHPKWLEGMKIEPLLRAQPGLGRSRIDTYFLREEGEPTTMAINPERTIASLTPREKERIAARVEQFVQRSKMRKR